MIDQLTIVEIIDTAHDTFLSERGGAWSSGSENWFMLLEFGSTRQ